MVRNAAKKTQEALFESGIYNKSPRLWYLKGDSVAEQEYTAWHNFYDGAWKDFRKMDSLLMKLQKCLHRRMNIILRLGLCQNQELSLGTPLEWMTMTLLVVMKTIGIRDLEGRQNILCKSARVRA